MIIRKHGYVLDVDVEETLKYSKEHTLWGIRKYPALSEAAVPAPE